MTTNLEYALLAGTAYFSTRSEINRFPIPLGWNEKLEFRNSNDQTGFEARAFQNGSEIVISYAGTYNWIDGVADARLGSGAMHDQLLQAVEYYLQVKAANPGATISLTGHSLGGGLANETILLH